MTSVLVVEDEQLVARDLENTLEALGYRVSSIAATGADAIHLAESTHPDLVLMDIRLKGAMDGVEAAQVVQSRLDLPVVFLSAYSDDETVRRVRQTNAYGYLIKPFNARELRTAIEVALQKHALQVELVARQRWLEATLCSVGEAVIATDTAGRVQFVNPVAEELTGWSAREAAGRPLTEVFRALDATTGEALANTAREALESGAAAPLPEGLVLAGREGGRRSIEGQTAPVRQDARAPLGAVLVFRDVSLRRRREAGERLLARASRSFGESLDARTLAEVLVREALPVLCDACMVHLLRDSIVAARGVDAERSARMTELAQAHPPHAGERGGAGLVLQRAEGMLVPTLDEAQLQVVAASPEQAGRLRALGARSWLCVPLAAGGALLGTLTAVVCEGRPRYDATDLALAKDLAGRCALALENARLYDEAQRARRARDVFIATAAHELRGPVSAMKLQLDVTRRAVDRAPAGTVPQRELGPRLERLGQATDRLARLIKELLDVSTLSTRRMDLWLEPVDLAAVVRDVLEHLGPELERAGAGIILEAAARPVGRWDRLRIEQVVTNLASNAIKHGRPPIVIRVEARDGNAELCVSDRGAGVSAENRQRIFEPFERATGDRVIAGAGMGLWIVRQITEALGGTVELASAPGEGATFLVRLPLAGPDAPAS